MSEETTTGRAIRSPRGSHGADDVPARSVFLLELENASLRPTAPPPATVAHDLGDSLPNGHAKSEDENTECRQRDLSTHCVAAWEARSGARHLGRGSGTSVTA